MFFILILTVKILILLKNVNSVSMGADSEKFEVGEMEINFLKQYGYVELSGRPELMHEDVLIDAIKNVQLFGGLNQTGRLNKDTIQLMQSKRCGVPDINRNTHPAGSDNKRRIKRFTFGSKGWKKRVITYYIKNWSSKLTENEVNTELQKAFDIWGRYGYLSFKRIFTEPADIVVKFGTGNHGDAYPFDGPGTVLAHAFYPLSGDGLDGDLHFDDTENWAVNKANPDGVDFFAVALHELGHSLGLAHSSESGSVMNPYYTGTHDLGHDDIMAMYELYISKYSGTEDIISSSTTTTTTTPIPPIRPSTTDQPPLHPGPPRFPPWDDDHFKKYPKPPPCYPRHYPGVPPFYPANGEHYRGYPPPCYPGDDGKFHERIPKPSPLYPRTTEESKVSSTEVTERRIPSIVTPASTTRQFRTTPEKLSTTTVLTFLGDDEHVHEHMRHMEKHKNNVWYVEEREKISTTERIRITSERNRITTEQENLDCQIKFDAASYIRGEFFLFNDKKLWRLKTPRSVVPGYPVDFLRFFHRLPENFGKIDAIYERCTDSNIIMFSGSNFLVFDGNEVIDGGLKSIWEYGLPRDINNVDAVFSSDDLTYIFSADRVWVYNETSHITADENRINRLFPNIPNNLDSALTWNDDIYFFKGNKYWVMDKKQKFYPENPRSICDYWL